MRPAALSGSLLSIDAFSSTIPASLGTSLDPAGADRCRQRVAAWHQRVRAELGPACAARTVFDRLAAPLFRELGYDIAIAPAASGKGVFAVLLVHGRPAAGLAVLHWGGDPAAAWRDAVVHGISRGLRWCYCLTGPALRIVDAERTYSRRYAEFDVDSSIDHPDTFRVLWGLLRADAFRASPNLLTAAVALSDQHRASVRSSLQDGVHDALTELLRAFAAMRRARHTDLRDGLFDESLIVIYRILFLLFAEARGLVPAWHPVYRDGYTIESLRPLVERATAAPGLWESLQAIARLAHKGCRAGSLRVPPFNGPLFSPAHAPLADTAPLQDGPVGRALLALTTRRGRNGRERISYGDLGVEQLGGVYERVLDFEPVVSGGTVTLERAERRKATGSFYTPRALTEYLVRRTLAPLVRDRTPEGILALRILDPAMGSGAFLVAACRYLARAYERALVLTGAVTASDVSEDERAGFRRTVAQRCLFGVDLNPMAVQLGRLSLWLATLSAGRPLTFLDHHLRSGNSLVGASIDEIASRPPGARRAPARALPLFDSAGADEAIGAAVGPRLSIALDPGDTIEQVRDKEHALASLGSRTNPLAKWKEMADLWCASWFGIGELTRRGVFSALADEIRGRPRTLPQQVSEPLASRARVVAASQRFFHWTLEFPEVFFAATGEPLERPGFDAVLGNPPWEMLRGDRGDAAARRAASGASSHLTAFARGSGAYKVHGDGQANLYQLFSERALSLLCEGGRFGMILPSGFASDHGCAALRRMVFDTTDVDTFTSVENRDGLFPIHRSLKFLLLAGSRGRPTTALPCRFGVRSSTELEQLPDDGPDDRAVHLPRALLSRISGEDQIAVPELRTAADRDIVLSIASRVPALGSDSGWRARFGRELNASDDKSHFANAAGRRRGWLPVIEGKQIQPFMVDVSSARYEIGAHSARQLLPGSPFDRARLAYRDVAAATNRVTLIAAIVPAGIVTTHTLFCLKGECDEPFQQYLCAIFNSYVANYLVRARVGTHVTVSIVERLPVPVVARDARAFVELASLSRQIAAGTGEAAARARLQGSHLAALRCHPRSIHPHPLLLPSGARGGTAGSSACVRGGERG